MRKIELIFFIVLLMVEKSFSRQNDFNRHYEEAMKIGEWMLCVSEFFLQLLFYFWNVFLLSFGNDTLHIFFFTSKVVWQNASHYSFTGGLFDGASQDSERVFKLAVKILNRDPVDRENFVKLEACEFYSVFHAFHALFIRKFITNFQHHRKLCTEMSLSQRSRFAKWLRWVANGWFNGLRSLLYLKKQVFLKI
jgi:hypothetical protein